MGLWLTEKQTENLSLSLRIKEIIHKEKSEFQDILIAESFQYGKVLSLDGAFQTTEVDEFIYHEMITHVPILSHPDPGDVLIIGGGDGGTVREVLKHSVKTVEVVEIDKWVIEVSKRYLPAISRLLEDLRVRVIIEDGINYLKETTRKYDLIIVDSPDPKGPAIRLFSEDFYSNANRALNEDGIFVAQTESPFLHMDLILKIFCSLSKNFPLVKVYTAPIPTYPSGFWSFTVGSKKCDPSSPLRRGDIDTKYYTPEIHKASFVLPRFLEDAIRTSKTI
ncbi:MAG: polyamine aminopropyltransferase [Nitrospirota bacterium]